MDDRQVSVYTQDNTKTERTQTSMPLVGSKHTTPVFKLVNTGHAPDLSATVIGAKASSEYHMTQF